mgnify:CR=1 FL=1
MKIYIITCGDYEDNHNEFSHTDFDLVINKMMSLKTIDIFMII